MGDFVGIDLGTTYSVVAHVNSEGKPEVIPNERGRAITPSVVYFGNATPIVGDDAKDYQAEHPKFGMFGSIHSKEACEAERGIFHRYVFTWMLHIFPYEESFRDVFSLNDDVAHVH